MFLFFFGKRFKMCFVLGENKIFFRLITTTLFLKE